MNKMGKEKRKAEDPEEMEEKIRELEARLNRKKMKLAKLTNEGGPDELQSESHSPEMIMIDKTGSSKLPSRSATPERECAELVSQSRDPEGTKEDPEVPVMEDMLPEEFILALGDEGKITEEKGENIRQEVVNRWNNILKQGIKKEDWPKLINKYRTPGNFPMAIAPKLNPELVAALSENTLKRDKKFEYRQNLVGKVLSCMGSMLTEIMKGNLNSVKLIEGINDSAKILCNMNHCDNFVRRHFSLSPLHNSVKKAVGNVTVDTYLFGENLGERLKSAKALERNGSLLQANPVSTKKQPQKANNSFKPNLNWKGPSQNSPKWPQKENRARGGPPRNHQQYQQPYHQPYHQQHHHRRPASKYQQSRSTRRR